MSDVSARQRACAPTDPEWLEGAVVLATQAGLPLVSRPFEAVAERIGATPEAVEACMRSMLERGAIRRIAAVPNHYAIGYAANGMSVWDVDDALTAECGRAVGALDFVSHCYQRPRRPPVWPYNLFAMVHGRDRQEVEGKVATIARMLGDRVRGFEVLYSTRILKKTGLRLRRGDADATQPTRAR